jgi:hypothetical protein
MLTQVSAQCIIQSSLYLCTYECCYVLRTLLVVIYLHNYQLCAYYETIYNCICMYVCVCMYVYVYIYIYMCVCVYASTLYHS